MVGLKASRGRLPGFGDEWTFAVPGVLSRSVGDTAIALAVTERQSPILGLKTPVRLVAGPAAKRLKVHYHKCSYTGVEPDDAVALAVEHTAETLAALGHTVKEIAPQFDGEAFFGCFLIAWAQIAGQVREITAQRIGKAPGTENLEQLTLDLALYAERHGEVSEEIALQRLAAHGATFNRIFDDCDAVLCPTLRAPAPLIGQLDPQQGLEAFMTERQWFAGYTPIHNASGAPSISLPLAQHPGGLPIGVQIAAAPGHEAILLAIAYELEEALPWHTRRPDIHAASGISYLPSSP